MSGTDIHRKSNIQHDYELEQEKRTHRVEEEKVFSILSPAQRSASHHALRMSCSYHLCNRDR